MFIKLTDNSGKKVCLNTSQILYVYESKVGLCKVVTLDGDSFSVTEPLTVICELLNCEE